jgi:hypothetical protein
VVVVVVVVVVVDVVVVLVDVVVVLVSVKESFVRLEKFIRVRFGPSVVVVVPGVTVDVVQVGHVVVVTVTRFRGSETFIICNTPKQSLSNPKPAGARKENDSSSTLGGKICGSRSLK